MSDYKLVPVEPTPEMLEAGADWCGQGLGTYEAKGRAATAYKFMLAAAPTVLGEPVGWVWHSYNQTNFTSGSHHKEVLEADGVKLTPVYTAPQPAEQQPAPDVTQLVEALEETTKWVERWITPGHPIAISARAALAAYHKGAES